MLKFSVALMTVLLTCMLLYVAYHGRRARTSNREPTKVLLHRGGAAGTTYVVLVTIVLIEILVRQSPVARSPLLWIHLPLAFTFATLFMLMRWRFDGLRSKIHRPLAYACLVTYAGALFTGVLMFYRM
jgi:hypothetical protein